MHPSTRPMKPEITPSQLAVLRRARVDLVCAPSASRELDSLALAGLLGREAGNLYRITTMGVRLLEQLDAAAQHAR